MATGQASLPPLDVTRAPEGGEIGAIQSGWRLALREFASNRLAVTGVAILLFFLVFCFLGPYIYHANLLQTDLINAHDPPGAGHPLGTDTQGFDVLGELMKGVQAALEVGFFAAFIAITLLIVFEGPPFTGQIMGIEPHLNGLIAQATAMAGQPPITVPAITLDGQAGGPDFPATDGTASAHHFTGPRTHRQVPGAGHNLPQEAPRAFAAAVLDLARTGQAR